ncbi:MAG: hypothetical protein LBD55_04940 [Treponema sp.]|nr:hypothetical protein [Treponema sp.]
MYLDFHSRWGESVPLSWLGNIYPEHTFSYSEDAEGFLWLNWKDKTLFSGRELLAVQEPGAYPRSTGRTAPW